MIKVTTVGGERVERNLAQLPRDLRESLRRAVHFGASAVHRHLRTQFSGPPDRHPFWGRRGARGPFLGSRSGHTRGRLTQSPVLEHGGKFFATVGSPDPYVKLHEEGGTVHGKQYLRIPTADAQTSDGVDRYTGQKINEIPGTFLFRSRTGKLWVAKWLGRNRLNLLYLLVRSITLRPRGMFAEAQKKAEPEVVRFAVGNIQLAVVKANT